MRRGKVRFCLVVSDAMEGRELGVSLRCVRYGRLSRGHAPGQRLGVRWLPELCGLR